MTRAGRWLLYGVVCLAALCGPAVFWNGGELEIESTSFIVEYTANRPILPTLFDPRVNDFGAYQARELSYFFDYLDAHFYYWVGRTFGRPLFITLSSLVAAVLILGVWFAGVRRTMRNVDVVTAALLAACFVSSFQFVSTMGIYYRSSKPLLVVAVLAFLFHVRHVQWRRWQEPDHQRGLLTPDALAAAGLCLCAGLLDRQGFFYVLVACAMLGLHYRFTRQLGDLLAAAGVAAAVLVVYNLMLAPALIYVLNGYWPDFTYQSNSLRVSVLWHPEYFWRAFNLLLANAGRLLGASGPAMLVAAAVLGYLGVGRGRPVVGLRTLGYVGLVFAAQVVMFGLMIHQHGPLDEWVDHRFWYFPLPYCGTVLFALAMWLDAALPGLSATRRRLVGVVLFAVTVSNVLHLGRDRQVMIGGPWFGRVYQQSELLKASIGTSVPDPGLDAVYRDFLDHALTRR